MAPDKHDANLWRALERMVAPVALVVAAAALALAALALGKSSDARVTVPFTPAGNATSTATIAQALPAACAFATKRANDLGALAANLFGPDAARPLTPAEAQELLRQVDEALTLRERACVR